MTNDIEKAINFYETIGLEVKKRWENHYAMMSAKGLNIGLHPSEEHSIGSGSVSLGFIKHYLITLYRPVILSICCKWTAMKQKEISCNVSPNFIHFASQKLFWLATGLAGSYEIHR